MGLLRNCHALGGLHGPDRRFRRGSTHDGLAAAAPARIVGAATWIALVLSLVGAVGVVQATLSKQTIQCACLGTVFKLPMSVVTVIENLGMAAMASWMLWAGM